MIAEKLRKAVLQAAMEGKLTEQLESDGSALDLVTDAKQIKESLNDKSVPINWIVTTISNVGDVIGGGTPKTTIKEYWNGNIPWITPADMSNKEGIYISHGKRFITQKGLNKSSARLLPKGSILLSSRAPIGYVAIASNPIATNQGFKSIVPNNLEMNKYIYYYLMSIVNELQELGTGTTFKEISGATLKKVLIPIPPLAEQKRIVEKLEVLLAEIDKLEQDEKALKELEDKFPERLKSAILRNAVSGKLTNQNLEVETTEDIIVLLEKKKNEKIEVIKSYNKQPFDIPENWRWIKIGDLGTMGMGQTLLKKDMVEKGDPVYSATISDDPLGYVNKDNNKLKLTKGDFVIPARGASIGYVNLIKVDEASSTQTTMYIKSYLPSISNYIYYCLLGMKKDVFTTTGTAQPQITVGLTKEQLIPLPPLEEQKRIVDKLDELFKIDLLNI